LQFWREKIARYFEIPAMGNPAIGNRVYTDKTRLRGLKTFLVREGGLRLCRREFYSPGIFKTTSQKLANQNPPSMICTANY
jgi:hypothetical protein